MKLWSWDKKPSTSKGRLKRGDIFCFAYNEQTYCFGRIIELDPKKHMCIVEIFDHISDRPEIDEETVLHAGRMIPPLNANFDNFEEGIWRIIGHDAFGNKEKYPEALYKNSPELPLHLTDGDIKQYIDFDKLPEGIQALMFVKRQSKSLASYYQKYITVNNARTISNYITELTKTKLSAKEKKNAELFFTQYGALI